MNPPSADPPHSDDLRVCVQWRDEVPVVKLAGSAHMDVFSTLRDQLVAVINENTRQLVLDLADLEFINSVGLGAIIAAHLRCRRSNAVVKLVAPQPAILEVLMITKLTSLFPIHPSVDAALESK